MTTPLPPPDDQSIRDLLLRDTLSASEVERTWRALGHTDWEQADRLLQRLAREPQVRLALAEVAPELLGAMRRCADPSMAFRNFSRFVEVTANPLALFHYLRDDPRTVAVLVALFAGSQFLSEVLLRNPEYFELLTSEKKLREVWSRERLAAQADRDLEAFSSLESRADALRRFQRLQLLRTGAADLLGLIDLPEVGQRLSDLAEVLIGGCLRLAKQEQAASDGEATPPILVSALGKLGGRELNYSSDIDLLLLRHSAAPEPPAHRVAEKLVRHLAQPTREGYLYRVDLRLRPYGRVGPLVPTLPSFLDYLEHHAGLWEQQACLKLRPLAGDERLGRELLPAVTALVYRPRPPGHSRTDIRRLKTRIETELVRHRETVNVKLGVGGIRDIEFTVQCLQLENGHRRPEVQTATTLTALDRLTEAGLLPEEDGNRLRAAYHFLRTVEHRLQMMHSQQLHSLPTDRRERRKLALRLGFVDGTVPAEEQFEQTYTKHTENVREVFDRLFGSVPGRSHK